jgi:inorganic triphosphatase YgiF
VDHRELELKFELTHEQLRQLGRHPALLELAVGEPNTKTLRSIYFDTRDQRLRKAGISLRVRSDDGGWVQTIKYGFYAGNGVANRVELETIVETPEPHLDAVADANLQCQLVRLTSESCLEPAFETVIKRIAHYLRTPDADFELALDEGMVRSGSSERALCEAELELKAGPPAALLKVASRLFAGIPIHMADKTKAERGYELSAGRSSPAPRPIQGEAIPLDRSATCRHAFTAIVSALASQIQNNQRMALETDDPEGPHQLRVGLRRLRSALRAFRPLIDIPALQDMDRHAQALARIVGELRDADVFIQDIYAPVAKLAGDHKGLRALRETLQHHRGSKRNCARAALEGIHWSHLQLHLVLFPHTIATSPGLDEPVFGFSHRAIEQAWKKAARQGKRLRSLSNEERHKLRKRLKKLRYTVEFFAPLYATCGVKPFIMDLKRLQNVFGYINDVVSAQQIEQIASARRHEDGDTQSAASYVLAWHNSRARLQWKEAEKTWQHLVKSSHFWR